MYKSEKVLKVYSHQKSELVAQVILNGYDIKAGTATLPHGAMRSFKIVTGDLWMQWNVQEPLILSNDIGHEAEVRVAALPVDAASFGLMEFL